ncbi:MAG: hypothetical protein K2X77_25115 [Candidatus Obscuribacterales bacterium]|nr:hypothetical protein [Candidatus Obscuribacterales bacterium]
MPLTRHLISTTPQGARNRRFGYKPAERVLLALMRSKTTAQKLKMVQDLNNFDWEMKYQSSSGSILSQL